MFTLVCLYVFLILVPLVLWDHKINRIYEQDRDWIFFIIRNDPQYNEYATEVHILSTKHYVYRYFNLSPWVIYSFELQEIIREKYK